MKSKKTIFNIILFITSICIFTWNYSIYKQIDPVAKDLKNTLKDFDDYEQYKSSLKESGMNQKELNDFLIKYGNGSLGEKMKDFNQMFDEDQLISSMIALRVLKTHNNKEHFESTKAYLRKYADEYMKDHISGKADSELSPSQSTFKNKYELYKKENT
jgi:hypothetical protein